MKKDLMFNKKINKIEDFKFNEEVANVFDNMVSRSIPIYNEIHKIIRDIVHFYFPSNGTIYDLGCSTGETVKHILEELKQNKKSATIFGIDNSQEMIKKAEQKVSSFENNQCTFLKSPIEDMSLNPSDFIIMNYTLQFFPLKKRLHILKNIYSSLKPKGIFILSEKIISPNSAINPILIELYHEFKKRNGYSELEISQKRESLENVLIPITPKEQIALLKEAGFTNTELVFRWYNFACYLGVK